MIKSFETILKIRFWSAKLSLYHLGTLCNCAYGTCAETSATFPSLTGVPYVLVLGSVRALLSKWSPTMRRFIWSIWITISILHVRGCCKLKNVFFDTVKCKRSRSYSSRTSVCVVITINHRFTLYLALVYLLDSTHRGLQTAFSSILRWCSHPETPGFISLTSQLCTAFKVPEILFVCFYPYYISIYEITNTKTITKKVIIMPGVIVRHLFWLEYMSSPLDIS